MTDTEQQPDVEQPDAPEVADQASEQQLDAPEVTDPDEAPAPAGLQFDQLEHCPTPWVCFPRGLPADTSHAVCVHGETFAESS